MIDYQNINWYEKDVDEVSDFLTEKLENDEQYPFFKWLMQHYPNLELDWIEYYEYLDDEIPKSEKFSELLFFSRWCKQHCPEYYGSRSGFFERNICNHYFYHKDFEKLQEHVDFVQQNAVSNIDTVTTRLLYQLIYNSQYITAISYSQAIWKPIDQSDELIGGAAFRFVNTLYNNELQKLYEAHLNKKDFDEDKLFREKVLMGFNDDRILFDKEVNVLKQKLDTVVIKNSISDDIDEALIILKIHFLKFMKARYKLPFIFSEWIWHFWAVSELFEKRHEKENWFYIHVRTLVTYINEQCHFLKINKLEIFGKVWGMDYVFEFFHHHQLLDGEHYEETLENIQFIKNTMIQNLFNADELWQLGFVFQWPRLDHDPYGTPLKTLFDETYHLDWAEAKKKVDDYFSTYTTPKRIGKEIEKIFRKKSSFGESQQTSVREKPKIGRNDPCPCGSGKKYKKCCMNLSD